MRPPPIYLPRFYRESSASVLAAVLRCRMLADMTEAEILAIERAYGVPVRRPGAPRGTASGDAPAAAQGDRGGGGPDAARDAKGGGMSTANKLDRAVAALRAAPACAPQEARR